MKDDVFYLDFALGCIARIRQYTTAGRDDFLQEAKTQDAVLRNLHTLTETTQRLSDEVRAQHPEVDWRALAAFRNVVVHNYLGLDLALVWHIVAHDLPQLEAHLRAIREARTS